MLILEMILIPIISLAVLFVLTKMMGYRQISQLSMYDYINGITIGSIASEMVLREFDEMLKPIIGMIVYTMVIISISILSNRYRKFRYFVEGRAIIIYKNDIIYNKQLSKAKMDIDEFLMQCRIAGYFNLDDIDTIVLETNGQLSFMVKESKRPVSTNDMNINTDIHGVSSVIIQEGVIMKHNLLLVNKKEEWILSILSQKNIQLDDVILLLYDTRSKISVYTKNNLEKIYIE